MHLGQALLMLRGVLVDEIKKQVAVAMKSGDATARDVLRLALGEIQTAEARNNAPVTEEQAVAAVRKLIKSNQETLGLTKDARADVLRHEIEVLAALLPKGLSVEDVVKILASEHEALKAAKNDGQATGIAVKFLKANGHDVPGSDVGAAVKLIRG